MIYCYFTCHKCGISDARVMLCATEHGSGTYHPGCRPLFDKTHSVTETKICDGCGVAGPVSYRPMSGQQLCDACDSLERR